MDNSQPLQIQKIIQSKEDKNELIESEKYNLISNTKDDFNKEKINYTFSKENSDINIEKINEKENENIINDAEENIIKSKDEELISLLSNTDKNVQNKINFNEGRWSKEEHNKFIEGLIKYGNNWKSVQKNIITRSSTQARSHAQKFFMSCKKIINHTKTKEENRKNISNLFDSVILNIIAGEKDNNIIDDKINKDNTLHEYYDKIEKLILSTDNNSKSETKSNNNENIDDNIFFNNNETNANINNNINLNKIRNFSNINNKKNTLINFSNIIKNKRKLSRNSNAKKTEYASSANNDYIDLKNNKKPKIFSIAKVDKKNKLKLNFNETQKLADANTQTIEQNDNKQIINIFTINVMKSENNSMINNNISIHSTRRKNPFYIDFQEGINDEINNNINNITKSFNYNNSINCKLQSFNRIEEDEESYDIDMNVYMNNNKSNEFK